MNNTMQLEMRKKEGKKCRRKNISNGKKNIKKRKQYINKKRRKLEEPKNKT